MGRDTILGQTHVGATKKSLMVRSTGTICLFLQLSLSLYSPRISWMSRLAVLGFPTREERRDGEWSGSRQMPIRHQLPARGNGLYPNPDPGPGPDPDPLHLQAFQVEPNDQGQIHRTSRFRRWNVKEEEKKKYFEFGDRTTIGRRETGILISASLVVGIEIWFDQKDTVLPSLLFSFSLFPLFFLFFFVSFFLGLT